MGSRGGLSKSENKRKYITRYAVREIETVVARAVHDKSESVAAAARNADGLYKEESTMHRAWVASIEEHCATSKLWSCFRCTKQCIASRCCSV